MATVRWWALVLVVLGCCLRCYGLGEKLFWHDEVFTGLAIASSSPAQVQAAVFDGRDHSREELLAHQFPRAGTGVLQTIQVMAEKQFLHPPLYFVSARAWTKIVGPSIGGLRGFSAFAGILSLPLVFLLCRELDRTLPFCWIAVGLVAISPLQLVYSQEARQYALWIDLLLLANWLLLVAARWDVQDAWRSRAVFGLYGGVLTMALYTHLLSVLVVGAHALFVVVAERPRRPAVVRRFAVAIAMAMTLFSPWACVIIVTRLHDWVSWVTVPITPYRWIGRTAVAWSRPFFDLEYEWIVCGTIPLACVAVCVVWVAVRAPRRLKWLFLPLAALGILPFVLADLFSGGWRTGVIRFQFPAVLAIQLCVAYALSHWVQSQRRAWRLIGITSLLVFTMSGMVSVITYARAPIWWNKATAPEIYDDARRINEQPAARLIAGSHGGRSFGDLMALVHLLDDHVTLRLVGEPAMPQLDDLAEVTFVWGVSAEMEDRLVAEGFALERVGAYELHRMVRVQH